MIVKNDRTALDACLADRTTIVLLLRDPENGSPGRMVHEFFEHDPGMWDPWHRVALISDLCPLTPQEKQSWFNNQNRDRYAVLCKPDAGGNRSCGPGGGTSANLFFQGQPDLFKILDALQGCP